MLFEELLEFLDIAALWVVLQVFWIGRSGVANIPSDGKEYYFFRWNLKMNISIQAPCYRTVTQRVTVDPSVF